MTLASHQVTDLSPGTIIAPLTDPTRAVVRTDDQRWRIWASADTLGDHDLADMIGGPYRVLYRGTAHGGHSPRWPIGQGHIEVLVGQAL